MHELPEGVEIINLVHDEVDAIVIRETLKATVDVITRAFQETFAEFYPASELMPEIKFSCGPSWGEIVPIDGTGGLSFSLPERRALGGIMSQIWNRGAGKWSEPAILCWGFKLP